VSQPKSRLKLRYVVCPLHLCLSLSHSWKFRSRCSSEKKTDGCRGVSKQWRSFLGIML